MNQKPRSEAAAAASYVLLSSNPFKATPVIQHERSCDMRCGREQSHGPYAVFETGAESLADAFEVVTDSMAESS